jgi:hypothetical protein
MSYRASDAPICSAVHNNSVLIHAKLTHYVKCCDLQWATSRKPLTLLGAPCLQYFGNNAIVLRKTTNEYFQYLFGPWDCPRIKITKHGQIQLQTMCVTDPRRRSNSAANYVRHRPETTLLYQIVQEYWPEFQAELANHGKYLPTYVTKEFDEYLKCGRLEHGFLRVRCESCR